MGRHGEADGASNGAHRPGKTRQPAKVQQKVQGAELGQRLALLAVLASKSPGPRFVNTEQHLQHILLFRSL